MHSNEETNSFSNHDTQHIDNLEQVEEIKLENSLDQCPLVLNVQDSMGEIKQLSTSGTQTPLKLIRLSLTQSSSDKQFIDSTYSSTRFDYEATESRDNAKSFSYAPLPCKTSVRLSREVTTQATPPHPSLTQSVSRTLRDTLQLSTSFSSCKSGPRNEILTVTTDYGSPSPDAFSILADTINGSDNRDLQDSYVYTYSSPNRRALENNVSASGMNHRRWRLTNCLRFMSTVNNEPDTHPYMRDAPPTYSAICASRSTTRSWRPFRSTNNSSFVAPIPPPSYAQAQGICLTSYSIDQLLSASQHTNRFWSPRPTTAICPRCTTLIVTVIEARQSAITHVAAFAFFLCGCWPCCMLPYCMNSCKNVNHYCPICRAYLGTYRPW